MCRILWDPSSGSIKTCWCVAPDTHNTGPNFTLPNTDYAHKTSQVISVKHVLILPEDGSQRIRNISEFLIVF